MRYQSERTIEIPGHHRFSEYDIITVDGQDCRITSFTVAGGRTQVDLVPAEVDELRRSNEGLRIEISQMLNRDVPGPIDGR